MESTRYCGYGKIIMEFNYPRTISDPCFSFVSQKLDRQSVPLGIWDDAPWGKIPVNRRADIRVEPAFPTGGLLGGSGGGRTSKLAALLKARREASADTKALKEANTQGGKAEQGAVRLLSKLSVNGNPTPPTSPTSYPRVQVLGQPLNQVAQPPPASETATSTTGSTFHVAQPSPPLPAQVHELPALEALPVETVSELTSPTTLQVKDKPSQVQGLPQDMPPVFAKKATPSLFALSMFGGGGTIKPVTKNFEDFANGILFYNSATADPPPTALKNAFVGPSPDDVVLTAQGRAKGKY